MGGRVSHPVGWAGIAIVLACALAAMGPAGAQLPKPKPRVAAPAPAPSSRSSASEPAGAIELTTDLPARIEIDGREVRSRINANTPTRIPLVPGPHYIRSTAIGSAATVDQEIDVKAGDVLKVDMRLAGLAARLKGSAASSVATVTPLPASALVAVPAGEASIGCVAGTTPCGQTPGPARRFTSQGFQVTSLDAFRETAGAGTSWTDADAACRSAGGRLPSEEEWEYAATVLSSRAPAAAATADCPDSLDWVVSSHLQRSDQRVARGPSIGMSCGRPRRLLLTPGVVYSNVTVRCVLSPR